MKKKKSEFVCNSCGAVHNKWSGKCDDCNSWNTIEEISVQTTPYRKEKLSAANDVEISSLNDPIKDTVRIDTNISELNRPLGGGLVKGAAILLGGDPGIGKSTLLLQLVASLSNSNNKCLYISGEESLDQIKLRAKRLNITNSDVGLVSAIVLNDILATIEKNKDLDLVIIDSIQTLYHDENIFITRYGKPSKSLCF